MPSQDEIFNRKAKLIDQLTEALDNSFDALSKILLKSVINEFADALERDGDTIKNTPKNYQLVAQIEKIYNEFSESQIPSLANQIVAGTNRIADLNFQYFENFADAKNEYEATADQIQKIIFDRLGISTDSSTARVKLKEGGYMDSLLSDNTIKNEIKNLSNSEVSKRSGFKAFKEGLEKMIVGDEINLGGFRQFYRNYAYDVYVNVDRTESNLYREQFGLTYFIYFGSIIKTSRKFCIERAGKVFSVDEAQAWVNDPWIKKNLEKGYITSYDPVQDLGLFACRHLAQFISDHVAKKLRPDLNTPKPLPPEKEQQPKKEPFTPEFKERTYKFLNDKSDSRAMNQDAEGNYTLDRKQLHQQIVDKFYNEGTSKTKTVYVLGGAPANGKSTLVDSGQIEYPELVRIDSDAIKANLPEYNLLLDDKNKGAAAFVHEESSELSKQIVKKAIANEKDFILDGVGDGSFKSLSEKIKVYKDAGNRVRADYVSLDTELSRKLALARGNKTGRFIPDEYLSEMNREISNLVPQLIANKTFNELYLWDTNVPGKPRLILSQIDGVTKMEDEQLYQNFLNKAK